MVDLNRVARAVGGQVDSCIYSTGSSNGFKEGEGICYLSASTEGMLSSSLLDSEHVVNTACLLSRQ